MFDRRSDLVKFLAVADREKIVAAADRLSITQPVLTRVIARLEKEFGGRLFERLPTGVRLTPLGAKRAPGIELKLRTASFAEGLRLLADGESDLHCGGIDSDEPCRHSCGASGSST